MYAQVHDNAGMAQGGLGVGLNLVKRLVELHGGQVRAESAGLQQGSRFTVSLPLEAIAALPADQVAVAMPPAAAPDAVGLHVLVVDDNVDAAQMLRALLEMKGHTVALAHNGAAALTLARQERHDAVFLDIGLPDQSGLEVALALRQIEGMRHAMLVALTGWGAAEDRRRSSAAGFDAHVTKPAKLEHVHAILHEAAARRDERVSARRTG
jgi:CheY-like chemotaxis protein